MMKIAKKAERALDRKKETEQKNRDTGTVDSFRWILGRGRIGVACWRENCPQSIISVSFSSRQHKCPLRRSLWREVWIVFRWPVAVILLSQLPLAGVTIPVVFFLRGFFLSYGIVALMEGMGLSGVLCAGVVFGPTCLLAVPVLFVLGTTGLLRKAESQPKGIPFFRRIVASLLVLALCVFLDQAVVPKLLGILLKALTMVSG